MLNYVKAKKHLGQHFLIDPTVAERIADAVQLTSCRSVIEIGPGMGVLTKLLLQKHSLPFHAVEIDKESVAYLHQHKDTLKGLHLHEADFLKLDLKSLAPLPTAIVGNFPYNISTQILFKAFENRDIVQEVTGMFQHEVAWRIASKPGNRDYGILSVLLQAYFHVEYLFKVEESAFVPPPKVKSGVIRLIRNQVQQLPCDEAFFIRVVKAAFNQRRKTLSNALKGIANKKLPDLPVFKLRAEQLNVQQFIELTLLLQSLNSGD